LIQGASKNRILAEPLEKRFAIFTPVTTHSAIYIKGVRLNMKDTYSHVPRNKSFFAYLLTIPCIFVVIFFIATQSCCIFEKSKPVNRHAQHITSEVIKPLATAYASVVDVLNKKLHSIGSAVVIDSHANYPATILTAFHVIDDLPSDNITMTSCWSGRLAICEVYECTVVATDRRRDLAILQTKKKLELAIPYVTLAKTLPIKGQTVWSIGNPGSSTRKVTKGVLSDWKINPKDVMIYISDIAIDHGNSGGGLFNSKGELIGITYAAYINRIDIAPDVSLEAGVNHGWALITSLPEIKDFLVEKKQNYLLR
jgi:S1-C subfamily serine protease